MNKDTQDIRHNIVIKGARVHNLQNIAVAIPKNQLVVITGPSGSGKSSLAFDTLYAEGQRRYIESLSAYMRQFLGKMNKPDVDSIKGIVPAIAIEQKVVGANPRSTVGTTTEIYDYLKLLFARIGKTISPVSGQEVKKHSVSDVVNFFRSLPDDTTVTILCPLPVASDLANWEKELALLLQKGFVRIAQGLQFFRIESLLANSALMQQCFSAGDTIFIVVDRVSVNHEEEILNRVADSAQTAFFEGKGTCCLSYQEPHAASERQQFFCDRFESDGLVFEEPSPNLFSFNSSHGACKRCHGHGTIVGIDERLVIPNHGKSIRQGAIAPWKGEKVSVWKDALVANAEKFNFPVDRPYQQLTAKQKKLLWTGNRYFCGLHEFFQDLEKRQVHNIHYRFLLARYFGKTTCPECLGSRLRKDATYVKIAGKSILDIVVIPLDQALDFFSTLQLNEYDAQIARYLLPEIISRLRFLLDVGLSYLTLNRVSSTLSGGEAQRIHLTTVLGSGLVGSLYVLDEPSIGLHPRDTHRLIGVLQSLKAIGNTVLVVEHEAAIMQAADYLIDIGPGAGIHGGRIVFSGTYEEILKDTQSLTGKYLSSKECIELPSQRRVGRGYLEISGACINNLKQLRVKFPLNTFIVVTGVSGSGKTSLVKDILYSAVQKMLGSDYNMALTGFYDGITGDLDQIDRVELFDQHPMGRSSRSNPVTYVKAWDDIRNLFAAQPLAKELGLQSAAFSFNTEGGRCATCEGTGIIIIEMQFMADICLTCEDCAGKRFQQQVLNVTYKEKNVADVLALTVAEALEFFKEEPKILDKLRPLSAVGLGYVPLGQASSTLSGGEMQRVRLASFLDSGMRTRKTLFIFDEPTTGLHMHDVKQLLSCFAVLLDQGNTVIVIEHNMDVIKCADWLIDMGPEGGDRGGELVFEGTPEALIQHTSSYTGRFLKKHIC